MKRKPYLSVLPLRHQGKVRDSFNGTLTPLTFLQLQTDAMSTHNVMHLSDIPGKGEILTALTVFWTLDALADIPHHVMAYGRNIYDHLPRDRSYPEGTHLRGLIVRELNMSPHEFIVRARMAGSLWAKYYSKGMPNPYGLELPVGLQLMSPFDPPIFTPTEKSETDPPERSSEVEASCSEEVSLMREVYRRGRKVAASVGVDIVDFKGEAGRDQDGQVRLADEFLTPDCCRFVLESQIVIGRNPPWMDKEIVRQEAELLWGCQKSGPPLTFSPQVIKATIGAYRDFFQRVTGRTLEQFQRECF